MLKLRFVPLAIDAERSANLIPERHLEDFYTQGVKELVAAVDVSILRRPVSTQYANKWFGSERFLFNHLQKIQERMPSLPKVGDDFLSSLEKTGKSDKTPSWYINPNSKDLQLYGLLVWECMHRMEIRFNRSTLSYGSIGFTEWVSYYMGTAQLSGILTEDSIRVLNQNLYQQSLMAFYRRCTLSRVYPRFAFDDRKSSRYCNPKTVPNGRFLSTVTERLRKLGIGPLGNEYIPTTSDEDARRWVNYQSANRPVARRSATHRLGDMDRSPVLRELEREYQNVYNAQASAGFEGWYGGWGSDDDLEPEAPPARVARVRVMDESSSLQRRATEWASQFNHYLDTTDLTDEVT